LLFLVFGIPMAAATLSIGFLRNRPTSES
jgi:hypothetical protein